MDESKIMLFRKSKQELLLRKLLITCLENRWGRVLKTL